MSKDVLTNYDLRVFPDAVAAIKLIKQLNEIGIPFTIDYQGSLVVVKYQSTL